MKPNVFTIGKRPNKAIVGCVAASIAQKAVDVLNEALEADPETTRLLVANRFPTTKAIEDHPTIACTEYAGMPVLGLLGVINGIVTRQTGYLVVAIYDEATGQLEKFGLAQ